MKHHLSTFRRSSFLRIFCILILAVMCAPCAMAAAVTPAAPTLATVGGFGSLAVVGGLGLAGLGLLNQAEDNGKENGGGDPKADEKPVDLKAAITQAEDKTLPLSQRFSVMLQALKGIPPAEQFTQVKAELATAKADLATANANLDNANKQITALQTDVKTLEQSNAKLEKENKDLAAKEQDIATRAKAMAKEEVGSLGFPAAQLPNPDPKVNAAGSDDDVMAAYAKLTDAKERAAFYAANIQPRLDRKN